MVTPIFDLSITAEKTDALSRLNTYNSWVGSLDNVAPYTNAQVNINEASLMIYNYTKYFPKVTDQILTVEVDDKSGIGLFPYKLISNISNIDSNDPYFEEAIWDTDLIKVKPDGRFKLYQFAFDCQKLKIYPYDLIVTCDYGFEKSSKLPEMFKLICIELVIHFMSLKSSESNRELLSQQEGDVRQQYKDIEFRQKQILKKLDKVRIA